MTFPKFDFFQKHVKYSNTEYVKKKVGKNNSHFDNEFYINAR